ncbi:MAG: rhomboid family intramembrane serine protease [Haloechinothrix sp.]
MSSASPQGQGPSRTASTSDWDGGSLRSPLGKSATLMLVYLIVLWVVDVVNASQDRALNVQLGVIGRDPDRLIGILASPFLHGNVPHLVANASAMFTLGLIAGLYGVWRFLGIVTLILLLGGLGQWLISPPDTITVGASGIAFGLFGYLLTRGLFDRRPVDIVVSLGVAVAFGYQIVAGVLPQDGPISWQGHLAGFVAGIIAAWLFRKRRRKTVAPATTATAATSPMDTAETETLPVVTKDSPG